MVADVEAVQAHLREHGVETTDVDDQPWGRFIFFSDPDGNGWSVQAAGARLGRACDRGYPSAMADPQTFRGLQVCGFAVPGSELRRLLVGLVLDGRKTATASLLVEWELDEETLPAPGVREAVIDADDRFVAEIETTECEVRRLADVDDAFARDEGESSGTAAAWRASHEAFWSDFLDELRGRLGDPGWAIDDDTLVVCQRFRLAERYPGPIPA